MAKDTSGPAFPVPIAINTVGDAERASQYGEGGMTLRDYFAAAAISGINDVRVKD